jgi:hypothetical protein
MGKETARPRSPAESQQWHPSRRELIAIAAMQAIVGKTVTVHVRRDDFGPFREVAAGAVGYADALIAELDVAETACRCCGKSVRS